MKSMKVIKSVLSLLSSIFLCGLVITKEIKFAVALLISSGSTLGITVYELFKLRDKR